MRATEIRIPEILLQGAGSLALLGKELKKLNIHKVLLVTDGTMLQLGYVGQLDRVLAEAECSSHLFSEIDSAARDTHTRNGVKEYLEQGCDCVLSLGGGACADAAKGIAILATNGEKIRDYSGIDCIPSPLPPLVVVLTSSGCRGAFSADALLEDSRDGSKIRITSNYLTPRIVVADPILSLSLPPLWTGACGLVSLGQAIEALVSKKSDTLLKPLALQAVETLGQALRKTWCNGDDLKLRAEILQAGVQVALASSNSAPTLLHALASSLENRFSAPYSLVYAALLEYWVRYSCQAKPEIFSDIAELLGENVKGLSTSDAAPQCADAIKKLCIDLEIPPLKSLIKDAFSFEKEGEAIAQKIHTGGLCASNPRFVTPQRIADLLKEAYRTDR